MKQLVETVLQRRRAAAKFAAMVKAGVTTPPESPEPLVPTAARPIEKAKRLIRASPPAFVLQTEGVSG